MLNSPGRIFHSRGVDVVLPATGLVIDGRTAPAADGAELVTRESATGRELARVAEAGPEDVDRAVRAAARAHRDAWGAMEPADRARLLRRVADLIEGRAGDLARLETADTGKPIRDSRAEVAEAADWFRFFADVTLRLRSEVIPGQPGYHVHTLREPFGVVGLIVPWNYPLVCAATKLAPALGAGNCAVLKPSEVTPLTALALGGICIEAGLPAGVVNVVPGTGRRAGVALVEHAGVGMVSFTGSTVAGRDILRRAAERVAPVAVELGGKSPSVVFADVDLDQAASTALFSFTTNQGQLCTAGSRLLVERPAHAELLAALAARARELRVGDPWDPETQLGALVGEAHHRRVRGYVERGLAEGARVVVGGGVVDVDGCEGGFFPEPTIFDGVDPTSALAQEEIFGPVLSVMAFDDEAEAVRLANNVPYGLAAGVWTRDGARALRMTQAIEAGIVYVNTMNVGSPAVPVGGMKASGYGLEGGLEQALGFTRHKSVWVNADAEPPTH